MPAISRSLVRDEPDDKINAIPDSVADHAEHLTAGQPAGKQSHDDFGRRCRGNKM